jgi:VWFA-related protein
MTIYPRRIALAVVFLIGAFSFTFGQSKTQSTPPPQDDEVVKITTKLVQMDVVVTDKHGDPITDLTKDDFEIRQDGKVQKITGVSYVGGSAPAPKDLLPVKTEKNAVPAPPIKVRPSETSRIITFVVDDGNCLASRIGMIAAREGIEKFIKEQMLLNDLVAIYRTRAGSSVFQQYTSDKAQLLKAARKIQWFPAMGSCSNGTGGFYEAARPNTIDIPTGTQTITIESESDRIRRERHEDLSRDNQGVVGTAGVLRYVFRGLEHVPGRKMLFFISDGISFWSRDNEILNAADVLRPVADLANRASVVINTIDARGVFDPGIVEAQDEISTRDNVRATDERVATRRRDVESSTTGLRFLAEETGGKFAQNQNFLDVPIKQLLLAEKGFYLVAYEPEADTFKDKNFNSIEVRVARQDLTVRSRAGFLGLPDEAVKSKKRTGDSELYEAIAAPIPHPGLTVQLSAYFVKEGTFSNFVRAMFHLEGKELTFTDEPGGMKKAMLDVVAVTLNDKNEVVDEFTRSHVFKIEARAIPVIQANGLIYSVDVPVKKPGSYNFRVAVRDANNRSLGSAAELVDIPDLKKKGMFISGLTMTGLDANGKFSVPEAVAPERAISITPTQAVPAIRRFARGSAIAYLYSLYNAPVDPATGKPNYTIQVMLYRDGKVLLDGGAQPAQLEKQGNWLRINDYGYMRLNPALEPGDYALQVLIKNADGKGKPVSEWVDFEVTE